MINPRQYGWLPDIPDQRDYLYSAVKPPKKCYLEAKNHLIESYYRIHSLSEMLICLAQGYPFVFGFTVYESFEAKKVASTA